MFDAQHDKKNSFHSLLEHVLEFSLKYKRDKKDYDKFLIIIYGFHNWKIIMKLTSFKSQLKMSSKGMEFKVQTHQLSALSFLHPKFLLA